MRLTRMYELAAPLGILESVGRGSADVLKRLEHLSKSFKAGGAADTHPLIDKVCHSRFTAIHSLLNCGPGPRACYLHCDVLVRECAVLCGPQASHRQSGPGASSPLMLPLETSKSSLPQNYLQSKPHIINEHHGNMFFEPANAKRLLAELRKFIRYSIENLRSNTKTTVRHTRDRFPTIESLLIPF
jgi:hypothetical protein